MRQRLKDIALGLFMAVIGFSAFSQVVPFDPIWRYVTIWAVTAVSVLAAMIFFVVSRDRR